MQATAADPLPAIIAGPIPRRVTPNRIVLWLALSAPLDLRLELYRAGDSAPLLSQALPNATAAQVRIGKHAFVRLIDLQPAEPLPADELLEYDLRVTAADGPPGAGEGLTELLPDLCYPGHTRPTLVIRSRLEDLVHGSCRKPHFDGPDALLRLDDLIGAAHREPSGDPLARPALLVMTGDQIYCDDVAGPMLAAIHQVIQRLGLYPEKLTGATVADSAALMATDTGYYRREELLPHGRANRALQDIFFGGAKKPIFTTASAHNHLITLAEVAAMYLLIWSPALWPLVRLDPQRPPRPLPARLAARYAAECPVIERFRDGLAQVRRALAHLPVYMIFDDHDITDDWNLARGWEEAAYSHPFSRRIIGNALIGYWLFQGWGNDPARHHELLEAALCCFPANGPARTATRAAQQARTGPAPVPPLDAEPDGDADPQDRLIDRLLEFGHWHYSLPTSPKLVVLDTRTHRWWSESSLAKPSGLMDWEQLSELQQTLMDEEAVVMVSAAPVLGVKLIENVQRVFTWFGLALLVDAENWMAHPGSANVMLNIFRHRRTPRHFVILSGDVHYSFVYDAVLRFRTNTPLIWQITASGLKNEFPPTLLRAFDRLNLWLYGTSSPLNWLTRRRRLRLRARRPEGNRHRRLFNGSALGRVRLDANGTPVDIRLLTADGGELEFPAPP